MTKKDYELMAHAINKYSEHCNMEVFNALVYVTASVFKKDNPNFQPGKYKEACLLGKHIRKAIGGAI